MDVCLEAVPEALEGDYVIVHAGFAISVLTDIEAQETLDIFKQLDEIQSQLDENQ
jgi:hydrogenase expression/formation protein HypC